MFVIVHIKKDEYFERDGNDLICHEHIPFYDMIIGTNITINSLYGGVNLKIPQNTQPESVLRIKDYGLPNMRSENAKGDLYVIESTSPIGTTEKMQGLIFQSRPELEGEIYIAYCPERVLPGNVMHELVHNDRVIGGVDDNSTRKAILFYSSFSRNTAIIDFNLHF